MVVLVSLLLIPSLSESQIRIGKMWQLAKNGVIPSNSFPAGLDDNGETLYVCRANYANGVHPGKIRRGFRGCNISFAGKEIAIPVYSVLLSIRQGSYGWYRGRNGNVPRGALVAGAEANRQVLYICKARVGKIRNGFHPGKVRPGIRGCNVPYDGREIVKKSYTVLKICSRHPC